MNPVDNTAFTRPLVRALHRHVDQLAASIPGQDTHTDHQRRQSIAAAWVYLSAVVAWAEDHHLVLPYLRTGLTQIPGRPVAALARAMGQLTVHPATQWLMHPGYNPQLWAGTPSDEAVEELARWWATEAPSLAHEVETGPPSITGWLVGDLLQTINDERRKGFALAQTPWWVCDLILDRTLIPALIEHRHNPRPRVADPTCGTGHMLIRALDYLWEWHTTGRIAPRRSTTGATGGTILSPERALPRVIATLDGIELDPLTAAVARLRLTVYAAYLRTGRPVPLHQIPRQMVPRVGVGDSLLLGKVSREVYAEHHPTLAALPGAGWTGDDWQWDQSAAPERTAGPAPVVLSHQQLDLFGAAA